MTVFSERLKTLRKLGNNTQISIAKFLEIAESTYQCYEYGKREPNFDKLIKLADYFNVSTDYLLGRTDNPSVNK